MPELQVSIQQKLPWLTTLVNRLQVAPRTVLVNTMRVGVFLALSSSVQGFVRVALSTI